MSSISWAHADAALIQASQDIMCGDVPSDRKDSVLQRLNALLETVKSVGAIWEVSQRIRDVQEEAAPKKTIGEDDANALMRLIETGDVDWTAREPFFGGTLLHHAVRCKSASCAIKIIEHAPLLASAPNGYGLTPLEYAKLRQKEEGSGYEQVIAFLEGLPKKSKL